MRPIVKKRIKLILLAVVLIVIWFALMMHMTDPGDPMNESPTEESFYYGPREPESYGSDEIPSIEMPEDRKIEV